MLIQPSGFYERRLRSSRDFSADFQARNSQLADGFPRRSIRLAMPRPLEALVGAQMICGALNQSIWRLM